MSELQSKTEIKKVFELKDFSTAHLRRAQAEQLQKELDSLALLLSEVKKQTEKVEAAADAIGDALLLHLQPALEKAQIQEARKKVRNVRAGKRIVSGEAATLTAPALQRM